MIPAATTVFATDASDAGVLDAREWIEAQGLTGDDVRLMKRDINGVQMCVVIAKVDGLRLTSSQM